MDPPILPPELQRLRRRFVALMILQGVLCVVAIAFAAAYFALHLAWGLPAFAIAAAAALAAQIRFIWIFQKSRS